MNLISNIFAVEKPGLLCYTWSTMKTTTVNVYEAKTQLSQLIDRALKGEKIVLARRGKPLIEFSPLKVATKKRELGFLDTGPVGEDFEKRCMEHLDIEWFK
jgi:antitoxin (DNA-binding transcriptional repressor) of toxin-antitoxin stability system